MWHEARRQERKIRGMLVDYRRRAERRRDFYEKIKADPTQFLQIHGRQCKIHLDPAIAAAADSASAMMPWQGQTDNLIDRFDVRAHLDFITPIKKDEDADLTLEERQINYERYRIIAQNSFLSINEEKFLKQLHLEEQFGYTETRPTKKESRTGGAAIGFNYEDGTAPAAVEPNSAAPTVEEEESEGNSDSDLDVDLSINVSKMDTVQAHEMNRHGNNFGMSSNDFYSFLTNDLEEAENFRLAKEEEHEKALFSGRKSRRERRAHREKRLANRVISPPSYAARSSPTYPKFRESRSRSKSASPENAGKITYITSFGDEEDVSPSTSKPTYADKVKQAPKKPRVSTERTVYISKRRARKSRSDSRSGDRSYKRRSRSRGSRSRSRRRSWSKYKRSRSRSKGTTRRSYRRRRYSTSNSSTSSTSTSSRSSSCRRKEEEEKKRRRSEGRRRSAIRHSKSLETSPPPSLPVKIESPAIRKSKSRSPPAVMIKTEIPNPPSPPKTRYYGRKKSDRSSSSELSDSGGVGAGGGGGGSDVEMKAVDSPVNNSEKSSGYGNSGTVTKKCGQSLSMQERLKRKRQALLNRQFKADKIAEQIKTEREKQEQQTREDELREMALKLRRRQREKRHAYDSSSSSRSDSRSKSPPSVSAEKQKNPSPHRTQTTKHSSSSSSSARRKSVDVNNGGGNETFETKTKSRSSSRRRSRSRSRDKDRDRSPVRRRERERERRSTSEKRVVYRDGDSRSGGRWDRERERDRNRDRDRERHRNRDRDRRRSSYDRDRRDGHKALVDY